MTRITILIASCLVAMSLFAANSECDDTQYQTHLESLDCQLVLDELATFAESFNVLLDSISPKDSESQVELKSYVVELERQENVLKNCLVKHSDDAIMEQIRDIYIFTTFAVLSLRSWILNRPEDGFLEGRARSKLEDLRQLLGSDMHNQGFNRTPESSGPAKPGELCGGAG